MTWHPKGCCYVANERRTGTDVVRSRPATGQGFDVFVADTSLVHAAVIAAEESFESFSRTAPVDRAQFLDTIARKLETRRTDIIKWATVETGLDANRIGAELTRTTGQIQLFADFLKVKNPFEFTHAPGDPKGMPAIPDLKRTLRPIGPVAVFGASNFPLAFSVAGGDTISAFAAGCPVVFKAHEAHPATSELVAEAIVESLSDVSLPVGAFSMLHGSGPSIGPAIADHPLISAIGFTGSTRVGRLLFDRCSARPTPIPFYGELGSVNPSFALPGALRERLTDIAQQWVLSLTLGAGQFCTNPGIVLLPENRLSDFSDRVVNFIHGIPAQPMLTYGISDAYRTGLARFRAAGCSIIFDPDQPQSQAAEPAVFSCTAEHWLAQPELTEEVFGPVGLLVSYRDLDEALICARSLQGQLATALHFGAQDLAAVKQLMPILERKCGRLVANGFPTGLPVNAATVHGGPYPASTNFGHTAVGTLAIRRWLRAVCWQDFPAELLPASAGAII